MLSGHSIQVERIFRRLNAEDHTNPIDEARRSSRFKQILKVAVPIGISAALVVWILYKVDDHEQIWQQMRQAAWLPLICMIPLSLLSHLLRAWRWRRFIGRPVSLFFGFTSVMIGYAVNDVLPRLGEVARVVNMNRMTKVPIANLLATLIAERLLDVIALVGFLGLSFCLEGEQLAESFPAFARTGPIALFFALLGLTGLFLLAWFSDFFCRTFRKIAGKIHGGLAEKGEQFLRQGADGLSFMKKPFQAVLVLIETAGIWAIYWFCFMLSLEAFGILEMVGWDGGTVSFSITVFGVLVPTVGAIGTYHEFGLQALNQLYDIDPALALACITVNHALLFYLVGGVCGALAWGLQVYVLRIRRRGKSGGD